MVLSIIAVVITIIIATIVKVIKLATIIKSMFLNLHSNFN